MEWVRLTVLTCFVQLQHVSSPRNLRGWEIHPLKKKKKIYLIGTSLVVQGLRLLASKAGGPGFDSWSGNYIPPGAAKEINNLPD